MRISLIPGDPGYQPDIVTRYNVYLNGKLLIDCHTADEEEGLAWVFGYDSDGDLLMDPRTGGPLLSIGLVGEVIIAEGEA